MGVCYSAACTDCKVVIDLDKFYWVDVNSNKQLDRQGMIELSDELKSKDGVSFRATLLCQFMGRHMGHKVVLFNEHSDCEELYDPFHDTNEYKEDTDYWG